MRCISHTEEKVIERMKYSIEREEKDVIDAFKAFYFPKLAVAKTAENPEGLAEKAPKTRAKSSLPGYILVCMEL